MPINQLSLQNTYGAGLRDRELNEFNRNRNALGRQQVAQQEAISSLGPNASAQDYARLGATGQANAITSANQFDDDARKANTEWLVNASEQVLVNPATYGAFVEEGKRRGVLHPAFNEPYNEVEFQQISDSAKVQGGTAIPRASDNPSAIQEYEYYNTLTPEKQRVYLAIKRSQQVVDIEGSPNVLNPPGVDPTDLSSPAAEIQAAVDRQTALQEADFATDQELTRPQRERAVLETMATVDNTLDLVNQALGGVNAWTTGPVGVVLQKIAGTEATDLQATVDTIVANLSFDRLQQMKESSKTGGALGPVSERELTLLGSAVSALSTSQSPPQMLSNLRRVEQHYSRIRAKLATEVGQPDSSPDAGSEAQSIIDSL